MPLHLLGKKSWNVYNQDNIARVRRDEAAAEAREAAEEQAMQEADAQRRLKILRGEPVDDEPLILGKSPAVIPREAKEDRLGLDISYADRDRKRKRQRGEDDTERDMRFAKRMVEDRSDNDARHMVRAGKVEDGADLLDQAGHINLFPTESKALSQVEIKTSKEEQKRELRKDREKDQVPVMRLSDAAGRSRGGDDPNPWYSSRPSRDKGRIDTIEQVRKDVWGNEDPKRMSRDQARTAANDPLAAMMQGVKQVRKVEADRKKWREERESEILSMRDDEQRRRRHRDRRRGVDRGGGDDLEGFSLDADARTRSESHASRRHHHHRHRRHGERDCHKPDKDSRR